MPRKIEERKSNAVQRVGFVDVDTIVYALPEEVYPEFLPEPVKIKSPFGEYEASFHVDQDNLTYIRKLKMFKGDFPPSSYQELIEFYRGVSKADNMKIVFMSKT